ncbi:MAG: hypothetical protein R2769_10530 [Saprospiraceae bacterium]
MVKRYLLGLSLVLGLITASNAQSSAFGVKGGAGLGIQQWDGYERRPLLAYHAIAFIEPCLKKTSLLSLPSWVGIKKVVLRVVFL